MIDHASTCASGGTMMEAEWIHSLRADPSLNRQARIAIGFAMHGDGFSARDIQRIASLRRGVVTELGSALNELDPERRSRPRGAPHRMQGKPGYAPPRSLALAVAVLSGVTLTDVPRIARRIGLHRLTAYGIRRAIDYTRSLESSPQLVSEYRCPACDQRSLHHPCDHCGHTWLRAA